ncbi:unnamed protein product [Arabis nemorensis]|uniref:RING-CH-type domain-containing protein n=1 Tax=Arabis nemorensis TaxID=586526 RepID=A0A565CVL9_9BRAS|nr:unnamed protein product [Arabis nemorensis]
MDPKSSISVCDDSSGSVLEAVIVVDVKGQTSDSVSKKVLIEGQREEEEDANKPQQRRENDSRMDKDGVGCSNISTHAVHEEAACVVEENETSKAKAKEFHMVDLSSVEESDGQIICRICHFGSDQSPDRVSGKSVSPDLIEIGCKCKNELGLAHFHCAETWFRLRGNSVCEICSCTAKNVTVRLMEEWNGERDSTMDERRRRGRGQSCCIFMVFLLIVLFLHWLFKQVSSYYQNTGH